VTEETRAQIVPVAKAVGGEVVRVRGTVGSILIEPRGAAPSLTASISDGTGVIEAIFMGRRDIPGIEPGRVVTIHGRVAQGEAGPHIFNPWYRLEGSEA
jgi:RecJ-like exonuclease